MDSLQERVERHLRKSKSDKKNKNKKYGRNRVKCARYRAMVGKPNGKGQPGNKRGKNS